MIKEIPIKDIVIHRRRLALKEGVLKTLSESIQKIGLISPPTVRPLAKTKNYELVAGAHRVETYRRLGRKTIPCAIQRGRSQDWASLAEIDENLARRTLSPSERSKMSAEQKKLYEQEHPETKHGGAPGKAGGGKKAKAANLASFVGDTSSKTGKAKRTVARDAARGAALAEIADDAAEKIAGTSLDKGKELDALIKLPVERARELVARAASGEEVSAIPPAEEPENPILLAWGVATVKQRTAAIAYFLKIGAWSVPA